MNRTTEQVIRKNIADLTESILNIQSKITKFNDEIKILNTSLVELRIQRTELEDTIKNDT